MSNFLDKVLAKCTKCLNKYVLPAMLVPSTHRHGDAFGVCTTCDSVVAVGKFDDEFLAEINVLQFDDNNPAFGATSADPAPVPTKDQVRLEGKEGEVKAKRGRPRKDATTPASQSIDLTPAFLESVQLEEKPAVPFIAPPVVPEPVVIAEKVVEPTANTAGQYAFDW